MTKKSLIAVHRIGVGKPKGDGTISYVEPGKLFEIDAEEADSLIASGAAKAFIHAEIEDAPAKKVSGKRTSTKKTAANKDQEPKPEDPETDADFTSASESDDGDDTDLM